MPIILLIIIAYLGGSLLIVQEALLCEGFIQNKSHPTFSNLVVHTSDFKSNNIIYNEKVHIYSMKLSFIRTKDCTLSRKTISRKTLLVSKQVIDEIR